LASILDKLRALLSEEGSLKTRAMKTAGWVVAGHGAQRALSLGSNLIMTRLLAPEAFGLMAMVLTLHMLVNMISDIGIKQSIVRSARGDNLDFLQVAWTVQVVRSAMVAGVVIVAGLALWPLGQALAPSDSVYADPDLPGLVIASSIVVILRGLESVGLHLSSRKLMMRKVATLTITNQLFTTALMVAIAWFHPTVWAIMLSMLIGGFVRTLRTHQIFSDTPMRWRWDKDVAEELWRFGRWLIGASAFGFVLNTGDRFILGALLDKTSFGIYVIATLWLQMGLSLVNQVSDQVVNASIAETMRKNRGRAPKVIARLRKAVDAMCVVGFLGSILLGPVLIEALYTPEYLAAGPFLALLSFRYLARRQNVLGGILLVEGRSDLMMANIGVAALALAVCTPLFNALFGLEYAILAVALAPFAGSPIMVRNVRRILPALDYRLDYALMIGVPVCAFAAVWAGLIGLPVPAP
jgi:O-antigen/teichoic acid export membrane protein